MRGSTSEPSSFSACSRAMRAGSGHEALLFQDQRLAQADSAAAPKAQKAVWPDGRLRRVRIAAATQINRRDGIPPLAFVGVGAQARLDAGNENADIFLFGGVGQPRGQRLIGKVGRTVGEIEAKRRERQAGRRQRQRRHGKTCHAVAPWPLRPSSVRREQPAARPGRFGLCLGDQPARAIRFDLFELVAIDRGIEGIASIRAAAFAEERVQQEGQDDGGKGRQDHPKQQR